MTAERSCILLAALAAVVAFAFQGSRGLYETTEGRYAEAGREMLETGEWLVPQLDYHPHWTKPPLAYWGVAGGMALLGVNEWGARACNAIAFLLIVLVVGRLGASLWDERTGLAAAALYAVSPFAATAANGVHTDMLLALWEAIVVLCYVRASRLPPGAGQRRWVLGAWAFLGLAFLTKGPPSLVVLVALAAYHLYLARTGRPRPRLLALPGVAAALAIGLGWFVLVAATHPGLAGYYVRDEIFARIATARHGRNSEWYKPLVIFGPPLVLGLGIGLAAWWSALRRDRGMLRWTRLKRLFRENDRVAFCFLWLATGLAIFSLARSRLPFYVLPIFPAAVLATAALAAKAADAPRAARQAAAAVAIAAAVLVTVKGAAAYRYRTDLDMRPLAASCLSVRRGDTGFYAFGIAELYGLQFYLRGNLVRVAVEPLPAWARRPLDAVILEMTTAPRHDTYVFVTDAPWREELLRSRISAGGAEATVVRAGKRYSLLVCRGTTPSSLLAGRAASGRGGTP